MEVDSNADGSAFYCGYICHRAERVGYTPANDVRHAGGRRDRNGTGIYPPPRGYANPHAGCPGCLRCDGHKPDAFCPVPALRSHPGPRPAQCPGHYRHRLPGRRNHPEGGAHHQGSDHGGKYLGGCLSGCCHGRGLFCRGFCGHGLYAGDPDGV